MEDKIKEIVKNLRENNPQGFSGIERQPQKYDIELCKGLIKAIGVELTHDFRIDDNNVAFYINALKWLFSDVTMQAQNVDSKTFIEGDLRKGLYIFGGTGTGKSLGLQVIGLLAQAANQKYTIMGADNNLKWNSLRVEDICNEYMANGNVDNFMQRKILCINDLGSEPKELLYMGNRINVMRQILEYRGDKKDLITIITSNLLPSDDVFLEKYGSRVVSRTSEMFNFFHLGGSDRRIKKII